MKIALTRQPEMKLLPTIKKIKNNPWVGVVVSLAVIIPCLYRILDDVTVLRLEYILLAIAFPVYIRSLKKIFDEILDNTDDFYD
ncbi:MULTISPECIES: hypothetical protein [Flavobacterium]|uniref:Uncharacterized protein n=1 Tax=Flavobacterium panici TaxID=2654843 RepID=A0A9N8J0J3_9FLAO|nr:MULTISPECIES: hypothetical protein [Flavobacterium]KOP40181.1 hypothetical protein AKO67_00675 [Flavobacterium sp. VMW]OWU91432.1 hypothetical protein APR43_08205 [Flavobacterium sp. NLM]UUF15971.1 hypothetical protein NLJ00_07580 [Flavobacterium panici]CAC9973989.1 hypothetical protein FLAPXU55_01682 [Flavobacterium panici]